MAFLVNAGRRNGEKVAKKKRSAATKADMIAQKMKSAKGSKKVEDTKSVKGGKVSQSAKKVAQKGKASGKVAQKGKTSSKVAQKLKVQRRKEFWYRAGVVMVVTMAFMLIFGGMIISTLARADEYQEQQENYAREMIERLTQYYDDYEKEIPKEDFEVEKLDELEKEIDRVRAKKYHEQKEEVRERITRLRDFAEMRLKIGEFFQDGILKSATGEDEIAAVEKEFDEMREGYREALRSKLDLIKHQYQAIVQAETTAKGMFADAEMEKVRDDLTRAEYNEVKARLEALPQRDIAEKYEESLKKADAVLAEKERIAEEERRRAEEEYRRRQAEIAAAWRVLNVPYWSQNGEGVKNGCEAASLLMALQYKGYLGGMNLRTYAEMMPKSDDPFTGFRGDIFGSAGSDAPFWIAPAPLAAFGRESSGADVVDITGASLDALDTEVAAGNPVVIYLTLGYGAPRVWQYGAPSNLHVMLLTGYNSLTGMQRLTDPLTLNGRTFYDLPRVQVESILNGTGNRAVVVR